MILQSSDNQVNILLYKLQFVLPFLLNWLLCWLWLDGIV